MTEAEQAAQDCERHLQEMKRQIVAMNAYLLPAMLEHKLALANGGTHTWENVACACRRCNGLKGARLAA